MHSWPRKARWSWHRLAWPPPPDSTVASHGDLGLAGIFGAAPVLRCTHCLEQLAAERVLAE